MGKAKYTNVCKSNKSASLSRVNFPNYIPYKDLAKFINNIDIGIVNDVNLLASNPDQSQLQGAYREPAAYIKRLAEFYLNVNNYRKDKLREFSAFPKKCEESILLVLAVGGDGAPGSGTAFLVSFLNCGQRISSSSENYLLFGANVEENSPIVISFLKKLTADISFLESTVFEINNRKVEFKLGELPNDMKMLSFLGGELTLFR